MTKKSHSISRSMVIVSIGTALSRAMGLLREILMAVTFGTSVYQSAFTVAFTVPNLFRRLFGEGALSAALIPVFTESLEKDGREKAILLARRILTMTAVILTLITLAGAVVVTVCLMCCKMNLKASLTFSLLRIMMPYMPFICVAALCMAVLNSLRVFAIPAMTSVLLNIVWIVCICLIRFLLYIGNRQMPLLRLPCCYLRHRPFLFYLNQV